MKKLVIGVDVSKDSLDFCVLCEQEFTVLQRGVVENNQAAIVDWLTGLDASEVIFTFEHTGHYGAMLAWQLSKMKFTFYMVNPFDLKRSLGIQRGKTDAIDAYRIASYTIKNKHRLTTYVLPRESLRKIKVLMSARDRYVKISVQLQNSLKSNEIVGKTIDLKDLIREEKKQIKSLKAAIKKLDKQMLTLIESEKSLKINFEKTTQVIGVGPITAIKCIAETDNFLKFKNGRKFSCHCGLAPFPYQSGSSINGKSRTHYLRNKNLKSVLFKAAGSAIQHDPQLKQYYERKVNSGKHKLSVMNAVANKIVLRIFAVVNREEPFVKLSA